MSETNAPPRSAAGANLHLIGVGAAVVVAALLLWTRWSPHSIGIFTATLAAIFIASKSLSTLKWLAIWIGHGFTIPKSGAPDSDATSTAVRTASLRQAIVDATTGPLKDASLRAKRAHLAQISVLFPIVKYDLFGTKNVQDAVTDTYVWMADQVGHIFLGIMPTFLLFWLWSGVSLPLWNLLFSGDMASWFIRAGYIASAVGVVAMWTAKEFQDYQDSADRAGKDFKIDDGSLIWNIVCAVGFNSVGEALTVGAWFGFWWFILALAVSLPVALGLAWWWLRQKTIYQQAGLPYLYRLASYQVGLGDNVAAVRAMSQPDGDQNTPRHMIICGEVGSGRTSLAVAIGSEYALATGIARYISLSDLVELAPEKKNGSDPGLDYDDGRVLWPMSVTELLIVDDMDACRTGSRDALVDPAQAAKALGGAGILEWLGKNRSIWVAGPTQAGDWQAQIAAIIGLPKESIKIVALPPPAAPTAPS